MGRGRGRGRSRGRGEGLCLGKFYVDSMQLGFLQHQSDFSDHIKMATYWHIIPKFSPLTK